MGSRTTRLARRCAIALFWLPLAAGAEPPGAGDANAPEPIPQSVLLGFLADTTVFTLLDARSPEEYAIGHLYGAENVPHDRVDEHAARLPAARSAPIVVYCKTGKRAAALKAALEARGYDNVRVLAPAQMFWSDTVPMFNCGVPEPSAGPAERLLGGTDSSK